MSHFIIIISILLKHTLKNVAFPKTNAKRQLWLGEWDNVTRPLPSYVTFWPRDACHFKAEFTMQHWYIRILNWCLYSRANFLLFLNKSSSNERKRHWASFAAEYIDISAESTWQRSRNRILNHYSNNNNNHSNLRISVVPQS